MDLDEQEKEENLNNKNLEKINNENSLESIEPFQTENLNEKYGKILIYIMKLL